MHAPVRSVPSRPSHQNTKTPLRRFAKHPIPFSLKLEGSLTQQDLPGVWQIAATSKSGTVLCWQHGALRLWNAYIMATLHHMKILQQFLLFFCDFLVPILTGANQPKWRFIFSLQEGHSAVVQKNYHARPWHIGTYTKSVGFLWPMCIEIWHSKVRCFQ